MSGTAPELSVILVCDEFETIRDTVSHLRHQTARSRLELVVVAPPGALELDAEACNGFWSVRTVDAAGLDPAVDICELRALGVEAAAAPVVLFGETHSFPEPSSFEAVIDAHHGPWTAVAQAIGNGNPQTMTSWTNLYLDYGQWAEPSSGGAVDEVPTHNGSFKRDLLLEHRDELPALLRFSEGINAALRARGGRFCLEPRARTFHVNVSRRRSWLSERLNAGRAYAAARCERWSRRRRIAYAVGSPLIPVVRGRRVLRHIRRTGRSSELLPRIFPSLAVGLALSGLGELLGYALGAGSAPLRVAEMELHRMAHVRPGDWPARP